MEARASCGVGLFILCISHARVGFAQTPERYVLSGAVLNSATRAVIAHALVSYNGPASGFRFTDVGGGFRVADAPCGQYWLNISKPGFLSESDLSPQFASLFNPRGKGTVRNGCAARASRLNRHRSRWTSSPSRHPRRFSLYRSPRLPELSSTRIVSRSRGSLSRA